VQNERTRSRPPLLPAGGGHALSQGAAKRNARGLVELLQLLRPCRPWLYYRRSRWYDPTPDGLPDRGLLWWAAATRWNGTFCGGPCRPYVYSDLKRSDPWEEDAGS
jgi:hypothetical protein